MIIMLMYLQEMYILTTEVESLSTLLYDNNRIWKPFYEMCICNEKHSNRYKF